jgi:hypothetical protein
VVYENADDEERLGKVLEHGIGGRVVVLAMTAIFSEVIRTPFLAIRWAASQLSLSIHGTLES